MGNVASRLDDVGNLFFKDQNRCMSLKSSSRFDPLIKSLSFDRIGHDKQLPTSSFDSISQRVPCDEVRS
jgi:hypothetical protein